MLGHGMVMYDALYAWCRDRQARRTTGPRPPEREQGCYGCIIILESRCKRNIVSCAAVIECAGRPAAFMLAQPTWGGHGTMNGHRLAATAALMLVLSAPALAAEADRKKVDEAVGRPGAMQPGGVYKFSFPRSDLKVIWTVCR